MIFFDIVKIDEETAFGIEAAQNCSAVLSKIIDCNYTVDNFATYWKKILETIYFANKETFRYKFFAIFNNLY